MSCEGIEMFYSGKGLVRIMYQGVGIMHTWNIVDSNGSFVHAC